MTKFVVTVKFPYSTNGYSAPSNKTYNFLTDTDKLVTGEKVVVDTVNGLTIAEVVGYSPSDQEFGETFGNKLAKWVIQKIDLTAHEERLANAKRIEELKKKMEIRRKKAAELEIYEILAKADPEMALLLKEFKNLQEVL
ncbi:MAG TPA: hypothetical protein VK190_04625 [Pseudoneobacillus sp.]|nr:hypothetical protein [Pseudoneobacillus sp.]